MAFKVVPPPLQQSFVDARGNVSRPWLDWLYNVYQGWQEQETIAVDSQVEEGGFAFAGFFSDLISSLQAETLIISKEDDREAQDLYVPYEDSREQQIQNLDERIEALEQQVSQRMNWVDLPLDLGNFYVEKDGTLLFKNDGTVWKDIMFPMAPPKTTGAGNPTLVTWNGNMRGYAFALNDAHDFDPQEIEHDAKISSTATWHIHFVSRDNETVRTVKYQLEYAIEPASGAIPAPTTISAEFTIAASTAANTPQRGNIGTFTIPGIAKLSYVRLTRIASSGTEPTTDPVVSGVHFHYELDTVGSREILTK